MANCNWVKSSCENKMSKNVEMVLWLLILCKYLSTYLKYVNTYVLSFPIENQAVQNRTDLQTWKIWKKSKLDPDVPSINKLATPSWLIYSVMELLNFYQILKYLPKFFSVKPFLIFWVIFSAALYGLWVTEVLVFQKANCFEPKCISVINHPDAHFLPLVVPGHHELTVMDFH